MKFQVTLVDNFSMDSIDVERGIEIITKQISTDEVLYILENFKVPNLPIELCFRDLCDDMSEKESAEARVFREFVFKHRKEDSSVLVPYKYPAECRFSIFPTQVVFAPIYEPGDGSLLAGSIKAWVRYNISQKS